MNYANIKRFDIANGPGIRVSLFVSGCPFHCKGCFNEATWDYSFGKKYTQETEDYIVDLFKKNSCLTGFSLLGGEPFRRERDSDYKALLHLVRRLKKETQCSSFWVWTGCRLEDLLRAGQNYTALLGEFDVLVDGLFIEEKKDLTQFYCGSTNQRVINLKESMDKNKVVLLNIPTR